MGFGTGVSDVAVILQLFIIMQRYVHSSCLPLTYIITTLQFHGCATEAATQVSVFVIR